MARLWMMSLARALIPGYGDPGLVYEQKLKQGLSRARVWVDAGCGDNRDILGEPDYEGLALGFDLPVRSQAKYLSADISAVPFKDGSVDFISCRWVFEHLKRPEEALAELERILKPGGFLLIRTTNRLHYIALLSRALPMGLKRWLTHSEVFPTFYRLNDRWAFRRVLQRHPCLVLEEAACIENLHYGSAPGFVLSVLTEWLLNRLGLGWLKFSILIELFKA